MHTIPAINMMDISKEELDGIYAFAVKLGRQAGKMLMDAAQLRIEGKDATGQEKEHVQKENAVDLVTETDEDVEAFIKKEIADRYPQHKYASTPQPSSLTC
jgi:myo-inositol-1(or 4)-monophosphatase